MQHPLMAWQGATQSGGLTDGLTLHLLMECPSKYFPPTVLLLVIVSEKELPTFFLQRICRYLRSLHFKERRAGAKNRKVLFPNWDWDRLQKQQKHAKELFKTTSSSSQHFARQLSAFCTERNFSNLNWIYATSALWFQDELIQPSSSLPVSRYQPELSF